MKTPRDLEFLYEIATLRNMPRGWLQHLGTDCASVLEHTMRVAWLALLIARREGGADEHKILRMALAHDLVEARVSDHSYMQKVYVTADEERANHDLFDGTMFADFTQTIAEYERRDTLEAKIVKDADNLDIDLELKELEERGHRLPGKWSAIRHDVIREQKLYTQTAKAIWDDIQTSDPSSWHLMANKWFKVPEAGK